jgi:hypothetical protein
VISNLMREQVLCWTDRVPPPRVPWAWDQAVACANAATPEDWERTLAHTPACLGCARAERALEIHRGRIDQHQSVGDRRKTGA